MSTTLSRSIRSAFGCAMISLTAAAAAVAQAPSYAVATSANAALPASVHAELAGTYAVTGDTGERATYRVFRQDGELRIQRRGTSTVARLVHEGNRVFHLQGYPEAKFIFTATGDGQTYLRVWRAEPQHVAASAGAGADAS